MKDFTKYNLKLGGGDDDDEVDISLKKEIIEDYYEGTIIGKGAFGSAMLCEKKSENNCKYVIKIIDLSKVKDQVKKSRLYDIMMNEIFILDILREKCEKYIMCYIKSFIKSPFIYIVCEYLENYNTLDKIFKEKLNHIEKIEIYAKLYNNLILGLEKIHSLNICHRDIKPENIMYNKITYDIKYIDFGFSAIFIDNVSRTTLNKRAGTPNYFYPELLKNNTITFDLLMKADYFSLGMVFFELLSNGSLIYRFIDKHGVYNDAQDVYDFNSNKNLNMIIGSVLFKPIFALENNILNYSMITNLRYESFTTLLNIKRPISIPNQENTIFSFPTRSQPTEPKQLYNGGISRKKK